MTGTVKPKLIDDSKVSEVFASEVVNVADIGGTVVMTFATTRLIETDPPKIERRVTARIALPPSAAAGLAQDISNLLKRPEVRKAKDNILN